MPRTITFHGAAQTVTGSKHLISYDGHNVLVDCGIFQGHETLRERNWGPMGFEPEDVDALVLTHAHMDHVGLVPRFVKQGYRGPVYATPATIGLAKISLPDSGRIQEEDARYDSKHGREHRGALYTEADAYASLKSFKPVNYYENFALPGGATLRYMPAGHILGSAFAEIYFADGERILMGGDLGRKDRPIIKDPTPVEFSEYLVIESTYGDRLHDRSDPKAKIAEVLNEAARTRSCVIVPSFAIGRTQELLWFIRELFDEGGAPIMPIYVDSPMASSVTLLYLNEEEEHDHDMKVDMREGRSPFANEMVKFIRDRNMSKALNDMSGPMVIISGSGMVTGGRVIHHLKRRLPDANTIVLFTGYQGDGTRGREIKEGQESIRIHGEDIPVRARIESLDSLSAHADQGEMMEWLREFKTPPRKTFIVHGEPGPQEVLAGLIRTELGWQVEVPEHHQSFAIGG